MSFLDLLQHEGIHFLLTLLAAVITWLVFLRKHKKGRFKPTILIVIGAFIGEFLLDTDHFFDYFMAYGIKNFRWDYFFQGQMFDTLQKTYVPFHAWEWILLLGIIIYFTKNISLKYCFTALALGILFHLLYDTYYYTVYPLDYSLIFRIFHNFDAKYFNSLRG